MPFNRKFDFAFICLNPIHSSQRNHCVMPDQIPLLFFPSMIDRHHQLRLLGILVYVYVDCINIDVKGVRGDERYPYDCINFAI